MKFLSIQANPFSIGIGFWAGLARRDRLIDLNKPAPDN
tara:strand:+ start:616 stop:729 length:114 start_codon:yes stop_codon:yes gene_type:complete